MNSMMCNRQTFLILLLAGFLLSLSQGCVSTPNRRVTSVKLVKGDLSMMVGDFDETGQQNKLALDAYNAGDPAKAYKILKPLAEKGDAGAQNNLGHLYLGGFEGAPRDITEAMKWYRKAAEQWHASAHFSIGMSYLLGLGLLEKDYNEGFRWIRKSAEQGYEYAQYYLGNAYAKGWGEVIPKDDVEAAKWMRKSAAQGNFDAQRYLENME
jgi:TPR repeat protein